MFSVMSTNGGLSARITISCRMNFDDYPLDAHTCQFQVGSCKYNIQSAFTFIIVDITSEVLVQNGKAFFTRNPFIFVNFDAVNDIIL